MWLLWLLSGVLLSHTVPKEAPERSPLSVQTIAQLYCSTAHTGVSLRLSVRQKETKL